MTFTVRWSMRIVTCYCIFLLTACTTATKPSLVDDPDLEWVERQSQLNKISLWKINGRLAVTNKSEVWHISVIWKQQDENYKIHLSGPFGAGVVQLKGDADGVIIKTANETTFSTDAEQLLYEKTGIHIPLQNLFYWVRGLANPESAIIKQILDPYGRLKELSQNNWAIRFKRYKKINNLYLPSKVFLKRNSLDIRFVIEEWTISS